MNKTNFDRVYDLVRQIPEGKVAAYGQIARWLGWPRGARTVGWALRALQPDNDVPWQRVVNAKGRISLNDDGRQRALLEAEGVIFSDAVEDDHGRIDLNTYGWTGPLVPWWEEEVE